MKRAIICLSLCIGLTAARAQFRKIPTSVEDAFQVKYPAAETNVWSSYPQIFRASFSMFGIPCTADFTNNGQWLQFTQQISKEGVPQSIMRSLKRTRYATWELKKAIMVMLPNDQLQYCLQLAGLGIQERYLFYNAEGVLQKETLSLLP